jgi:hypothetical protein
MGDKQFVDSNIHMDLVDSKLAEAAADRFPRERCIRFHGIH